MMGVGLQVCPGSREIAQGQAIDTFYNGISSSQEDFRRDDSRRRDDDRQYDSRDRDDSRRHSRRESSDPEAIVRRAYEDVLNRAPDQEGLRTYRSHIIDDNWSEQDVRNDLRKSAERRETGGISLEQAQQMVNRAYRSVLGRDADSSGSALYVERIRKNHWSEADVAKELRNSSEYRNKHKK